MSLGGVCVCSGNAHMTMSTCLIINNLLISALWQFNPGPLTQYNKGGHISVLQLGKYPLPTDIWA